MRTKGKRDRVYVTRAPNEEATSWQFPTYGDALPHDLVHLVVEAAFGVRDGFWGRVAAGVDIARINQLANRMGGKDKYAGFGENLAELLFAEALAGAPWARSDAEIRQRLLATSLPGIDVEARIADVRFDDVRACLERLRQRWVALGEKGTLEVHFDPRDPCASFAALRA